MLDSKGFDLWADDYDRTVGLSDAAGSYPFAGYRDVLGRIYRIVAVKPDAAVLDLGFGTGVLTSRLYERGCTIYGQDFSAAMIEQARAKMPGAVLVQGDLSEGLAPALLEKSYDFILSTYALHHLSLSEKETLLRELFGHLNPGGQILIGDVAFRTRAELNACRTAAGDEWDEEEIYFVEEEMKSSFPDMEYEQLSCCAGLMILRRDAGTDRTPDDLRLFIPRPEDGWFYRAMVSDPKTMAYNAPWFPPDGCIPFPDSAWQDLQDHWIGQAPVRFYAFLQRVSDGAFVGDVNYHRDPEQRRYGMGILIRASERGRGYGKQGLRLLLDRAFRIDGLPCLHNDFELSRAAACRIHRAAGFRDVQIKDGILHMELTREEYLSGPARKRREEKDG